MAWSKSDIKRTGVLGRAAAGELQKYAHGKKGDKEGHTLYWPLFVRRVRISKVPSGEAAPRGSKEGGVGIA